MGISSTTSQLSGKVIPIILLAFAILSTIGIYAYNMHLESKNETLTTNIDDTKLKIINIQKDPNLQVFKVLTDNKKTIDMLTSQSQVTTFISRLTSIENKYLLKFGGFNYAGGIISTSVVTSPDSSLSPYLIVSDFIKGYRGDSNTFFTLPLISQVSGSDSIKFSVKFNVKDNLPVVKNVDTVIKPKSSKQTILEKIEKRNQKVEIESQNELPIQEQ